MVTEPLGALTGDGLPRFAAERAISPVDGSQSWVVIDADLVVHREASDFLRSLGGMSRSPHTIRAYAGRVARFLGWCEAEGVDWRSISLTELARFKHWVEVSPLRNGGHRAGSTVNAILTVICELLRFCARTGVIEPAVAERLSESVARVSPRPASTPVSPDGSAWCEPDRSRRELRPPFPKP